MNENFENYVILEEPKSLWQKLKDIPMTYYLVGANVLVFIMIHLTNMFMGVDWLTNILMKNSYPISMEGEYYRLFTAIFTHTSISHILFNCMAILILGKPVEMIFGKWKFLIIFLVSGLFGSLSSFIFSEMPAIGASGGVFGMFGVHIYLFLVNKSKYLSIFGKDMFQLLIINVVIGFALPNIDYWGHFGGILGGFLATASLGLHHKIKINKQFIAGFLVTVVLFGGLFLFFSNEYNTYHNNLQDVLDDANAALRTENASSLIAAHERLKAITPFLPPISDAERLDKEISVYIYQLQNK